MVNPPETCKGIIISDIFTGVMPKSEARQNVFSQSSRLSSEKLYWAIKTTTLLSTLLLQTSGWRTLHSRSFLRFTRLKVLFVNFHENILPFPSPSASSITAWNNISRFSGYFLPLSRHVRPSYLNFFRRKGFRAKSQHKCKFSPINVAISILKHPILIFCSAECECDWHNQILWTPLWFYLRSWNHAFLLTSWAGTQESQCFHYHSCPPHLSDPAQEWRIIIILQSASSNKNWIHLKN